MIAATTKVCKDGTWEIIMMNIGDHNDDADDDDDDDDHDDDQQ